MKVIDNMKILMIHPHDIYSASEPWTIRITSIAKAMVEMGHEVKLIYFPLPEKERGLIITQEPTKYFETIPFNRSKWAIFHNMRKIIKYAKWADVIHFQKCFAIAAIPAIFASAILSKPVHYDWDDWEYLIYQYNPPSKVYGSFLNYIERFLPKIVDTISVASDRLKEEAVSLGFPEDRIVKASVCADLNRFNPEVDGKEIRKRYGIGDYKLVLYLGQLNGAQYTDELLKAMGYLSDIRKDVKFLIVGGGSDLERLKHLRDEYNLKGSVIFTGFLPDEDIPKCLAAADVAVGYFKNNNQQKSKSPLKIVEYLASGKAIVASNVGEVPFMIDHCGVLVEPDNPYLFAKKLDDILDKPELLKKMGECARKRAEEIFTWSNTAKNILKAYKIGLKLYKRKRENKNSM